MMNQQFLQYLLFWIEKVSLQHTITIPIFIMQYHKALYTSQPFIFILATPFFLQLVKLLKQFGYIHDWIILEKELLQKYTTKKLYADVIIIWMKPWGALGSKKIILQVPQKKTKLLFLTYKQTHHVTSVSKSIYIFTTPSGLVTHHHLLKNKIGGTLVCILK